MALPRRESFEERIARDEIERNARTCGYVEGNVAGYDRGYRTGFFRGFVVGSLVTGALVIGAMKFYAPETPPRVYEPAPTQSAAPDADGK